MTEKVKNMLALFRSGEHKRHRINNEGYDLTEKISGVDEMLIPSLLLEDMLRRETPIILDGDIFGFNRRNVYCPSYTNSRGNLIRHGTGNLTPNYASAMERGLENMLREVRDRAEKTEEASQSKLFYEAMERDILIKEPIDQVVMHYAKTAKNAGLDGIVCSPLEAGKVHDTCGKEFLTITPGVRFADGDVGDQKRVMTPAQAKEIGSDYIVVGRPITAAADPVAAYERCVAEFVD